MKRFSISGTMLAFMAIISSIAVPAEGQYFKPIARPGIRLISVLNNLPVAQITSAASLSQPGATQRYFQVVADRPGTCTKGSGGDAASFTLDSTTCIYTINNNAAGDGTTQLVRTLPVIFIPADGTGVVNQNVSVTLNTIAAPAAVSESYTSDFTGTAGTTLDQVPGWAIYRTGSGKILIPQLDGTGNLKGDLTGDDQAYQREGSWAVLYSPTTSTPGGKVTFTFPRTSNDGYEQVAMVAGATDQLNGYQLGIYPRNSSPQSFTSGVKQNGIVTSGGGTGNSTWKDNDTLDVEFDFTTPNQLTVTAIGKNPSTNTLVYDLTGKTVGNKFGFMGLGSYSGSFGNTTVKSVSYVRAITTLAVTAAPSYSVNNIASYSLSWTGAKPVALQHRFYDENGTAVTPWMTGDSVVTGTGSGSITYNATAPPGFANLQTRFRVLNDTPVVAIAPNTTAFSAVIYPFQMGYNVRAANYYQPVPMLNNWGKFTAPQGGNYYMPADGIGGYANVQSTVGTVFSSDDPTVQIISGNASTGQWRINVIDGTGAISRYIRYTGVTPTQFDVTRDGLPGKIAPEWVAGVEGEWLRDLDMSGQNTTPVNGNYVPNTTADKYFRNDAGVGPDSPYQDTADAIAAKAAADPNFKGYWSVIRTDMPDSEVTARAIYQRDNIPQRIKIALEFGNELWNDQFTGVLRSKADGVRNGWYGDNTTYATKQPNVNVSYEGSGAPGTVNTGDAASVRTQHDCQQGDYIMANVYSVGNAVYLCKQFAPAGTYISGGGTTVNGTLVGEGVTYQPGDAIAYTVSENAYFHNDLTKNLQTAGVRWRTVRHNQIIEIYRSVFGETRFQSQIVPTVMGRGGGTADVYNQFVVERTFVPGYWDKVKGSGLAFYLGPPTNLPHDTVTAAQLETAIRGELPLIKAQINQVFTDNLKMGKIPMYYEGITHPDFSGYSIQNGNYRTQWDALFNSDAGKQIMSDWAFFMKTNSGGIAMGYDLVGSPPWSLKLNWRDLNNKRRLGWLEGLARTQ